MRSISGNSPAMGILTLQTPPYMGEEKFFRLIARYAHAKGLSLIVFSPQQVQFAHRRTYGYKWQPESSTWKAGIYPLPRVLYDRCFFRSSAHYRKYQPYLLRLRKMPEVQFLGWGLSGKWEVYEILSRSEEIRPYLPSTLKMTHTRMVVEQLQKYRDLVIKPQGGSLGVGVIRLQKTDGNLVHITGRDRWNRPYTTQVPITSLRRWLDQHLPSKRNLIQPYLSLHTPDHRPFDLRVLVQKKRKDEWAITGHAIRVGRPHTLTSNLHGGGTLMATEAFLRQHYPAQWQDILATVEMLSRKIPPLLEKGHGPLVELGLDFGIDLKGHVWLLEANSKPGRRIMQRFHTPEERLPAVYNIVDYALDLLKMSAERKEAQ